MMRICFWAQYFWPCVGGSEILAGQLLPELRARGHELVVISSQSDANLTEPSEYQGIAVHRFPFRRALESNDLDLIVALCRRVTKLKRSFAPEVVHMFSVGPLDFFHHQTARAYRAPTVVTVQQHLPPVLVKSGTLPYRTLKEADWVTCCSTAVLDEIRRLVPAVAARSSVIHNGLNLPLQPPSALPQNPPRLLCVGRLLDFKGFDLAMAAFAVLLRSFPEVRLVLAGDGIQRPHLERLADRLDIAASVDFLGWVRAEDVSALINAATLVVVPSRREPFGLVALQAAQMARPAVVTRVGGLPEVVLDGETGLVVAGEDPKALADAITFLLRNPDVATAMGRSAHRRAQEVFGWTRFVDAIEELLDSIVRRGDVDQEAER